MSVTKKKNTEEENPQQTKFVQQKYRDRLSILRKAQEYSLKDDIPMAVTAYHKYLESLALYWGVDEKKLHPDFLVKDKNITEILLISQVYWDLAKAYDRNQKLKKECDRCLGQFVLFSTGFKFQFLNSEMLRKYLKKRACYNIKSFEMAYAQIRVNSKNCYIATYVFGENHEVTTNLRLFKTELQKYRTGHLFIEYYYRLSPKVVSFCDNHKRIGKIFTFLIKMPIHLFSKLCRRFIIF